MSASTAFKKYSSIENSYRQKVLDSIRKGYDSGDWVVTEKAHGANACFIVDNGIVEYGKRTSTLTTDEARKFYNSLDVFQKYAAAAQKVWELLGGKAPIIIYGELLGGCYPDTEKPTRNTTVVQKGVFYCPHNDFYAFDILVGNEYLDYDTCIRLFEETGFVHAKPLFRGSFAETLEWSTQHNDDPTTIPALFGCMDVKDNIREGNVLKPVISKCFPNGSRVILKDKNSRFAEVSRTPRPPTVHVTEDLQPLVDSAIVYITDTRLDNVLSKEGGEVTHTTVGKLMGLLTQDAIKDWEKDWTGEPVQKELRKPLNKVLMESARRLVLARL